MPVRFSALTAAGVTPLDEDRVLYPLVDRVLALVRDETVARLAESVIADSAP